MYTPVRFLAIDPRPTRLPTMRMCRWILCGVIIMGLLVLPTTSAAQAKRPLKEVELDLRAGIVNDVLPFDERFIVTATIADTVTDVHAWIARVRSTSQGAFVCPQPEDLGWTATTEWRGEVPAGVPPAATTTPRRFRLLFPALEANGYYCIRFDLGPEQPAPASVAKEFSRQAQQMVDGTLRSYGNNPTVTTAETNGLRRQMLAGLRSLSGLTPRGRKGTLFDATLPDAAVHTRMLDLLDPILRAQTTRRTAVDNMMAAEAELSPLAAGVDRRANDLRAIEAARITQIATLSGVAGVTGDHAAFVAWFPLHQKSLKSALDAMSATHDAWDVAPIDVALSRADDGLTAVASGVGLVTPIRAALVAAESSANANRDGARTAATAAIALKAAADEAVVAAQKTPDAPAGTRGAAVQSATAAAATAATAAANAAAALTLAENQVTRTRGELDNVDALLSALRAESIALQLGSLSLREARSAIGAREDGLARLVMNIEGHVLTEVTLLVTSQGNFETRHGWYVSMDAGLAYGWDINEAFGYLGTNIYFRPVNKDAPLQSFGGFRQSFSRRASALIGLTVTGQVEETDRREALLGGRILVVGGGLRMTDSIRFAGGALVFKAVNPNPLVTERRVEISPFVSMSFDIDVVGSLGDLGKVFGLVNAPAPAQGSHSTGVLR